MQRRVSAACLLSVLAATLVHGQTTAPAADTPAAAQNSAPTPPPGPAPASADLTLPDDCRAEMYAMSGAAADAEHADTRQANFIRNAECVLPDNARMNADSIAVSTRDGGTHIVAEGNVVFSGPDGHINAE